MFSDPMSHSELRDFLTINYPDKISKETNSKRRLNINHFINMIDSINSNNKLSYGKKEARIILYETETEEISIQFPGKETIKKNLKYRPYDFRPKIKIKSENIFVRDMGFKEMWAILENLKNEYSGFLQLLTSIFFQLGRMTLHTYVEEKYTCSILTEIDEKPLTPDDTLNWYKLTLSQKLLDTLNFHADKKITIDENISISLVSFLYFFDLILLNEDIKYFTKKGNLSSGRIPTSDSMLLITSCLNGDTKLSDLLQRFVSGYAVARCLSKEITAATGGLVTLVNRKNDLLNYFEKNNIKYTKNGTITINKTKIHFVFKCNSAKTIILSNSNIENETILESREWTVFNLESALNEEYYTFLCDTLLTQK